MKDRQLFRGKLKDSGKWVYGGYSEIGGNPVIVEPGERGFNFHIVAPSTVGQCTGGQDRNEQLIYEGDIVVGGLIGNEALSGVIVWCGDQWRLTRGELPHVGRWDQCAIIGNIDDNHELLEDKDEDTKTAVR